MNQQVSPEILKQKQVNRYWEAGVWQTEISAAGKRTAEQDQMQQTEELNLNNTQYFYTEI